MREDESQVWALVFMAVAVPCALAAWVFDVAWPVYVAGVFLVALLAYLVLREALGD